LDIVAVNVIDTFCDTERDARLETLSDRDRAKVELLETDGE
jgi:hypothetical protein